MDAKDDTTVWNAWYVVGSPTDIRRQGRRATQLLDRRVDLTVRRTWISAECDGRPLPVVERLGYVWTTLGDPSGLRVVDNVIDNAHFPFVHPGILGDADHLELVGSKSYTAEDGTLWLP